MTRRPAPVCYASHPDPDTHLGVTCALPRGHQGRHIAWLGPGVPAGAPGRYINWPNHTQPKGTK